LRIIDNLNELLGDDLKSSIKPGSKLRIAASTFSIFAFEALKEELQSIKELEFIFTAPSFTTTKARLHRRSGSSSSRTTGTEMQRSTAPSLRSACATS
jgi:hypothetical protein